MANATHVVLPGSYRRARPGATAVRAADPAREIEVTLKLRRKAAIPAIDGRPDKAWTREELADAYGIDPDDVEKVADAFRPYGLKVVGTSAIGSSVRLAGTVGEVEKAFEVRLMHCEHADESYRGRTGNVLIPSSLDGVVVGVFGLDTRRMARRRPAAKDAPGLGADPSHALRHAGFLPAELAELYEFPPGDGAGQSIAALEFGGGYFPDDLAAFCETAGVAVPTVVPISVNGQATDAADGQEGEVMLDVEVIAGACPKATIPVYFSTFDEQGWVAALDAVMGDTTNRPTVVSISWGLAEDDQSQGGWTRGAVDAINDAFRLAALARVTVLVASGDDGSGDQEADGHAHVDFPASSPYVVAVGGTDLRVVGGRKAERTWKDGTGVRATGGGSTGGGVSVHFARMPWQAVRIPSVNPGSIDGRVVPDVAAEAETDLRTRGYYYVVDGNPGLNGGTSAATPLWAALVARINAAIGPEKRVGYLTPLLYRVVPGGTATVGALGCTDITDGDNITAHVGGYRAGPGFDAVTGWGSPRGVKLLEVLRKVL